MSFDWNQYIVFAENLLKNPSANETDLRIAISRAYYGAFIPCRNYCDYNASVKKDIHKLVIDKLKGEDAIPDEIRIGNLLDALRSLRGKADYDGFYSPIQSNVINEVKTAKAIIALLGNIKK